MSNRSPVAPGLRFFIRAADYPKRAQLCSAGLKRWP